MEVKTDSKMTIDQQNIKLPTLSNKNSQGYIQDLRKLKKFELKDLLERQDKLLSNKFVISKLSDKGEKIRNLKEKILKELDHRNEVDDAARLLSKLNIAKDGKSAMNQLEWTGKYSDADVEEKIVELDSDDDEDPIKILAQPTGTGVHKKKIIHLPKEEESLIKPEDLKRIESFNLNKSDDLEHVKHIINIVENPDNENTRVKFMPYKTTKTNVHDPMKEKIRKKGEHWEVTAATPPHIIHGAVKCLSINESMQLQKEQAEKLTVIQLEHAAKRLAEKFEIQNIPSVPTNLENYRTKVNSDSESSEASADEDDEVYDEEAIEKERAVVYSISNFD